MSKKSKISKQKSVLVLLSFIILALFIFVTIHLGNRQEQKEIIVSTDSLEFVTVANPDSSKYITAISPIKAVDILLVAKHFYNHEEYWSYIFRDNDLENLLNIPSGTIIKIPRLDSVGQKDSLAKAKLLGDQLLKEHSTKKRS